MNRHYTSEEYLRSCTLLRQALGDVALTTDVIVGFPGETPEEFEASYSFVERVGFYETHIFKYSRREGTRAALMPGQVPEEEKALRSDRMLEMNARRIREYEERHLGRELEVLLEEEVTKASGPYLLGHSREYIPVAAPCGEPGQVVKGRAEGFLEEHVLLVPRII